MMRLTVFAVVLVAALVAPSSAQTCAGTAALGVQMPGVGTPSAGTTSTAMTLACTGNAQDGTARNGAYHRFAANYQFYTISTCHAGTTATNLEISPYTTDCNTATLAGGDCYELSSEPCAGGGVEQIEYFNQGTYSFIVSNPTANGNQAYEVSVTRGARLTSGVVRPGDYVSGPGGYLEYFFEIEDGGDGAIITIDPAAGTDDPDVYFSPTQYPVRTADCAGPNCPTESSANGPGVTETITLTNLAKGFYHFSIYGSAAGDNTYATTVTITPGATTTTTSAPTTTTTTTTAPTTTTTTTTAPTTTTTTTTTTTMPTNPPKTDPPTTIEPITATSPAFAQTQQAGGVFESLNLTTTELIIIPVAFVLFIACVTVAIVACCCCCCSCCCNDSGPPPPKKLNDDTEAAPRGAPMTDYNGAYNEPAYATEYDTGYDAGAGYDADGYGAAGYADDGYYQDGTYDERGLVNAY